MYVVWDLVPYSFAATSSVFSTNSHGTPDRAVVSHFWRQAITKNALASLPIIHGCQKICLFVEFLECFTPALTVAIL